VDSGLGRTVHRAEQVRLEDIDGDDQDELLRICLTG
jgi:hypothetical protein